MKHITKIIAVLMTLALIPLGVGCTSPATGDDFGNGGDASNPGGDSGTPSVPTGTINVISREDGSGTRSAFVELFEVQTTNAEGKKVDATTSSAVITNSTSVMMTTVAHDDNAIGYLSLGSLDSTVRAVPIDGVDATTANVRNNSYRVSRPFNIVTTSKPLSAEAQDFITYIMSKEGQAVIAENHYIAVDENAPAYHAPAGLSGKVVVAGSSSVSPVMEKLAEAYHLLNPNVTIEIQTSDSGTGITSVIGDICDIGMSSRALKDSETSQGASATTIAIDGIAVIVNNSNGITGLTSEQVTKIFLGEVTTWEAL